mmetsp:Transcript_1153/g.1864  ORF Transcript_1153/g.1864 Transcript_1153/m.1864 type:complete len:267 (-) Transcript_1153:686-1486(-)
MLHQILVRHHLVTAKRERQGNRQRQSLWYRHGQNSNGQNKIIHEFLRILALHSKTNDGAGDKGNRRSYSSQHTNLLGNNFQLLRQRRLLIMVHGITSPICINTSLDLTRHTVHSHGNDHHLPAALDQIGATQYHIARCLAHQLGLSRERTLVHLKASRAGPQQDAIGRNAGQCMRIHAENVSHHNLRIRHLQLDTSSGNHLDVLLIEAGIQPRQCSLLRIIDTSSDQGNNSHTGEDGSSFNVTSGALIRHGNFNDYADDAHYGKHH